MVLINCTICVCPWCDSRPLRSGPACARSERTVAFPLRTFTRCYRWYDTVAPLLRVLLGTRTPDWAPAGSRIFSSIALLLIIIIINSATTAQIQCTLLVVRWMESNALCIERYGFTKQILMRPLLSVYRSPWG